MKINFDQAKCSGHAQCFVNGPGIYVLDDNTGYCALPTVTEVPVGLEEQAANGANACPEGALTITP
ncbi:ferredoxin [Nocardia vinacea]|uniref:ferredoxin n=1 Tax=Nocardia vinacea TaxID=96468 RepID=UPI000310126D|nr:ferredoxin [Nocardia vinacea]